MQFQNTYTIENCYWTQKLNNWGLGYHSSFDQGSGSTNLCRETREVYPPQFVFIFHKGNNAFTLATVLNVCKQSIKFYIKAKGRSLKDLGFLPHLSNDKKAIEEEKERRRRNYN